MTSITRAPLHVDEISGTACPEFTAAMDVIGKRWNGIIVQTIGGGPSSFTEISRFIGQIGDTMLAKRLRELEADGLVTRTVTADRPVGVHYSLAPRGAALVPILDDITAWGHAYSMASPTPSNGEPA